MNVVDAPKGRSMMATHELRWKVGDPFLDALEGRMITPRVLEQAWRDMETGEVEWVPVPEARVNQREDVMTCKCGAGYYPEVEQSSCSATDRRAASLRLPPWRFGMHIKVRDARKGLHPRETIVTVDTLTGPEELVVDRPTDAIDVGYPVATNGKNYLVELPSETSKGSWRVWVHEDTIHDRVMEAAE